MNRERVLETAAFIERAPDNFYMAEIHCGTSACIAGYAATLAAGLSSIPDADDGPLDEWEAERFLELTGGEAEELFYPPGSIVGSYEAVPAAWAVRVLRNFAETGEVDWAAARSTPTGSAS